MGKKLSKDVNDKIKEQGYIYARIDLSLSLGRINSYYAHETYAMIV